MTNHCINPALQGNLVSILLRFRRFPVGVGCDVAEMYLQVRLREEDRDAHRFLWRDLQLEEEPQEYRFCRVMFGVNASPFLALGSRTAQRTPLSE